MPIVILLGGGHAAGKHTAGKFLREELSLRKETQNYAVHTLDMDEFIITENTNTESCSHKPSRFDFESLKKRISELPNDSIAIVIGLYALYDKGLRDSAQIKVFIDSDADVRLIRWIRREAKVTEDEAESRLILEKVIGQYMNGARSEMTDYIFPTKEFADVIFPRGVEASSVRLIVDGIQPSSDSFKSTSNQLRPSRFAKEKFDKEKGKFYELN
ncbi:putative uridine kinase Das2p [[Candida] anglica]|uniref:Uridine kinase Das2p n=1 Tax=[Candida] anglica TaxID=148631 RepID=A0ABP0EHU0_9ASCO